MIAVTPHDFFQNRSNLSRSSSKIGRHPEKNREIEARSGKCETAGGFLCYNKEKRKGI